MKKTLLVILTCAIFQAHSGGLITNSNQSASYIRMMARGASTDADAVYYNPAGLAFIDEGLTISLNGQMIWMKRTIENDLPTLNSNKFEGKLFVPIFPGVYAAYKKGNWTYSLGFNPPAGGGSVKFNNGLPMLENQISLIPGMLSGMGIETTKYSMESMMEGTSIVYGVQANATYKINDMFGISGGIRMSLASNSYKGYVRNIQINPRLNPIFGLPYNGQMVSAPMFFTDIGRADLAAQTSDQSLDVKQTGSGVAPIFGVHFRHNSLDLAVKYEFQTNITLTNKTKENAMNMYPDGQELRSDVPAVLSLAMGKDNFFHPKLKVAVTYLHHFEKQANLQSWNATAGTIVQREKLIDKNTHELMVGAEWKLNDKLTLSAGYQISNVGVSNAWQNDISHNLDNITLGLGFAYRVNDKLTLNFGAINTWYDPVTISGNVSGVDYKQTFDRTNRAIAVGVDYRF
jgi:long-chain fatty acid transport protein